MDEPIVFDNSREMLNMLWLEHPRGRRFLCPTCGRELEVILSWDEARQLQKHPGVYCPAGEPGHVFRMFNLGPHPSMPRESGAEG